MCQEITGTYGSNKTECIIFTYNGWYCVEGSVNVNHTTDDIIDGMDIEELSDNDFFTWSGPINSCDELIEAVEN